MSYTPYTTTGACKTADEVNSDIAQIASIGFSSVRLYATDCSGLPNVGGACKNHGLKLIAGIFIDESGISKASEQVSDITSWGNQGNWDTIEMIVIGNEAIFNNYCTAEELAGFITSTKETLKSAGYTGPCTTTEPLGTLMANKGAICGVVDVVAANIQPFFNAAVSASDAGSFVASQLELTGEQCPGKTAYNLECGWPSNGSPNGEAVPGPEQQKEAIGGVLGSSAASHTVIFSFENDAWKGSGDYGVEPYFGCADIL
ncbi:glycoside hydrolase [Rhizodiscina lignyota]|uniref:Probable beta-glucosidase btgE n=1 Tax=Rhizodiscina lignyota TaxID=1504668 RepID=A0A9P4I5M6_9PEZI|nr:glycoside hydrolase [Rhizodiscina lignyota]